MKTLMLMLLPLVALACGHEAGHEQEGEAHEEHAHAAKHGGDLVPLGDHEGFLEVKADQDAGTLAVWVYMGEDMRPASLDRAPVLNLKTAAGPRQLTGTGAGGAWTFADEALRAEPEGARFRVVVEGKSFSPEWEHDHAGHEGHDDE